MRLRLAFMISALSLLAAPQVVNACQCGGLAPIDSYKLAYAVVTGKIISEFDSSNSVKLKIEKNWKNKIPSEIILVDSLVSMCPPHFLKNKKYLVYFEKKKDGIKYIDCMGGMLDLMKSDLKWLEKNALRIPLTAPSAKK